MNGAPGAVVRLYDARRGVLYERPLLRGWMHLVCFGACVVVGAVLIAAAGGGGQRTIASVYAASVAGMFGISALYHRGRWSRRTAAWLQRLDHLMIFVLIAGTATAPIAVCVPAPYATLALVALWTCALAAAVTRLIRMHGPEWIAGAVFLGLGWLAGAAVPAVWMSAGVGPAVLLLAGGVLYTAGAFAYHWRWPNPRPSVFGYHEVFHSFVCVAAACQYVAIGCFLL